jgi:lysophospholipase L1-like esterase
MIDPAPTRRTTARTRRRAAVLTGVLATSLLPIAFGGSTTAGAAGATSKFVSIAPKRVVDSRDTIDLNRAAPLTANVPTDITLAGIGIPGQANVVPATATAVVATFTVVGATNDGWLQVLPKGQTPAEATSTLNVKAGNDVASTVFVALGTEGKVTLTATFGAEILVDIAGYFTATSTSTDGRFVPLEKPTRLIDTRGAGYLAPADIAPTGNTTPTTTVAPTTTAAATTTTVAATTTTVAPTTTVPTVADGKRVFFLGDSITVGDGESTFRRALWNRLKAANCGADFVGSLVGDPAVTYTFDNQYYGWGGAHIIDVGEYAGYEAAAADADIVVINLGTNDAQFPDFTDAAKTIVETVPQTVASSLADLQQTVANVRETRPDAKFVIVAPYNLDIARVNETRVAINPQTNERLTGLRTALTTWVATQSGIVLVDADPSIQDADLYDGVHPNAAGDVKLANMLIPSLNAYLGCSATAATTYTTKVTTGSAGKVATPKQAGTTFTVPVAGRVGVPTTGVGSVVLSLTATNVTSAGYLQVSNGTAGANDYSSLNVGVGDTRANLVVVPLSAGNVSIYTTATADVIVDVVGYFTDGTNADGTTGLFVPATPNREYNSRNFDPDPATKTIALSSEATGKSAVIVNLTSTANTGGAWVQVGPTPVVAGAHSNLNVPADSTDIAVGAISKIGTNRSIDVHYEAGTTEIIVDVMGWFS